MRPLPSCWSLRLTETAPFLLLLCLFGCHLVSFTFSQAIDEDTNISRRIIPKFYTLTQPDSQILLSANGTVAQRIIASEREIKFYFRTHYPSGIILYETFYGPLPDSRMYTLLLALVNGRFQVIFECDQQRDEFLIGYNFNRDLLHRVLLHFKPELGFFNIQVIAVESKKRFYKTLYVKGLTFPSNEHEPAAYKLALGSIPFTNEAVYYQLNGYRTFVGCLGNFSISSSRANESNFDTFSKSSLSIEGTEDGCVDQCAQLNLCSRKARCINYYDGKGCDCFGTQLEDWHCRSFNYTVLTLRGYSSISYQIYSYFSKTYSDEHLVSLHLKTAHDSILFAALSEATQSYLILNIKDGYFNVIFNLGSNPKNYIFNDFRLTDNAWHNLTIVQKHSHIFVHMGNETVHEITLEETDPYFYFDPEVYIGGFPSNLNISSLHLPIYLPNKKFVGCLKHVYFNSKNILYDLHRQHPEAKYHSLFPLELGCQPIESVSITVQPNSFFKVPTNRTTDFDLKFEIKLERFNSHIANGTLLTANNERRKWTLLMRKHDVKLSIESEQSHGKQIPWTLSNDNSLNVTAWNKLKIEANRKGIFRMTVNQLSVQGRYDSQGNHFYGDVTLGSVDGRLPFVGCFRNVVVNQLSVEPRTLAQQSAIVGRISLDDCQLVRPCNRPNACEHGGTCKPIPANGTYICDCSNTGYIGKTCHFSVYRRSCEEVYLMDKRHSGIYMIDIDRNGPLPPAHVICDLLPREDGTESIRTVIEHNMQHQQVPVRKKGNEGNYMLDVVYRDFNNEMLRVLVRRSDACQQYVKYDCHDAPLNLASHTLLYSTVPGHKLARIEGSNAKGCKCGGQVNTCIDPNKDCNCDSSISGWKHDEGVLTSPDDVGITRMFFFQLPNATRDSQADLVLGNLSCIDTDTQKYEITFRTKQSYMQVPGWVGREMGISFKTTESKAVIFYQAHLNSTNTYFKAVIQGEKEVSFEYSFHGKKNRITLVADNCLNCNGKWQHIWIERNEYQMRVSINQNSRIMYLGKNEKFIEFDGALYVGGAPLELLKRRKITLGFIGCLRGLVFDNQVINLHRFLDQKRKPNIESGCRPSCKANLCKNQGRCKEMWGSYECECSNAIAHSGRNCQVNINENSITFQKSAFIREEMESMKTILQKDIIFSFRTHSKWALLLYAHDLEGNFVHVHLEGGSRVIFTFSWLKRTVRCAIQVGSILVSGQTVQVKIDRSNNKNNTFLGFLIVNQRSVPISYPELFSKESTCSMGNEFQLIKQLESPSSSGTPSSEVFVGGVPPGKFNSSLAGFVGCFQGLVMADKLVDLHRWVAQLNGTVLDRHVKVGCRMLCDQMPCKNNGICTEDWENESTNCDCESTSYRGEFCDIDIGAYFQKNSSVLYYLEDTLLDFSLLDISFAFSSGAFENCTLLLLRYANSTRYLHIALLDDGRLIVEEDNGHDMYQAIIESDDIFLDSHRHWVRYKREERNSHIIVDSEIHDIPVTSGTLTSVPMSSENVIQIGSNRFHNQDMSPFSNFKGCISNINIILDNVKIDPFESAFGIRSGLSNVKVFGDVKQAICASFHTPHASIEMQIDQSASLMNQAEIWLNRPNYTLVPYKRTDVGRPMASYIRKDILMPVCVAYLLLVLFGVSLYMYRIDRHYRLLKFQGETPFFHKKQNLKKSNFAR